MKQNNILFLGFITILLLAVSSVSAHPDRDTMPHHGSESTHMPMIGPRGFDDTTQNVQIIGDIEVKDTITISLSVQPNTEMMEQMRNHHSNMNMEDYSNSIIVSIIKVVEFEDDNQPGYDNNDTVISEYLLNEENLEEPEVNIQNGEVIYEINSIDNVVSFDIYLRNETGIGHSWKWSVELNYNFQMNSSSLAILQSVQTGNSGLLMPHHVREMHHNRQAPEFARINESNFNDEHDKVPMFFKWDDYALIDNATETVTGNIINGDIALSMPQGDQIFYDPEIGIVSEKIDELDKTLDKFNVQNFLDTINSPTVLGLILGVSVLGVAVLISRYVR